MAQSPAEMEASMVANIPEKTGKTLAQWFQILEKKSFKKHGEVVSYLKSEHGVTHGFANLIAHKSKQVAQPTASKNDLVSAQYSGDKVALKPVYEALISAVQTFGPDMEIAPKKAYVSLRRNKQFAIIQPSTKSRIDIGINLKGFEATERLQPSGGFNAMVSHRVRISSATEIDSELKSWLQLAYQNS
jgi:predicted transport protein